MAWSKTSLERFIEEALLTEEEEQIMRTRVAGWTIKKQAFEFNMSESKVSKIIARLKVKYDYIQKTDPLFPPRIISTKEKYLDEN